MDKHAHESCKDAARKRLGRLYGAIIRGLYDHGLVEYGERHEIHTDRARVAGVRAGKWGDAEVFGNGITTTDELTPADLVELHVLIVHAGREADARIAEASVRLAAEVGSYDAIAPDTDDSDD